MQLQSIFTALLMAAQGGRATEPAVIIYVYCASVGIAGLQSHGACSHNLYTNALLLAAQGCGATKPVVTVDVHCAAIHSALLLAAQSCTEPRGLQSQPMYYALMLNGTELQSFISCAMATPLRCCGRRRAAELYMACGYGDYATLLLAAEGCAATLPAAVASTLSYRGRRRAAGLHCLWLW